VSLPGRCLAPAIDLLAGSLPEESAALLRSFHAAVVASLRGAQQAQQGSKAGGGRGADLEELAAAVRALVAAPAAGQGPEPAADA
jgi:hypothetical protein